jgi:hypothetical protein
MLKLKLTANHSKRRYRPRRFRRCQYMLGEESKLTLVLPSQNHTAENQDKAMSQAESTLVNMSRSFPKIKKIIINLLYRSILRINELLPRYFQSWFDIYLCTKILWEEDIGRLNMSMNNRLGHSTKMEKLKCSCNVNSYFISFLPAKKILLVIQDWRTIEATNKKLEWRSGAKDMEA